MGADDSLLEGDGKAHPGSNGPVGAEGRNELPSGRCADESLINGKLSGWFDLANFARGVDHKTQERL